MNKNPWLIRQPGGPRRFCLICFSYGGGSAANYRPWQAVLGSDIDVCAVQLPGRGTRMGETPYTNLDALIKELANVIASHNKLPFAFFGHSLGGIIAFELARHLQLRQLPMPVHLFVSGSNAPQHRNPSKGMHLMSDDELINNLREYNGTPPEILAHRELMEMVLPVIRADFTLVEKYQYRIGPLLNIPITVFAGRNDNHSSSEQVEGWAKETSKACRLQWFEGDHFFINSERDAVLASLATQLATLKLPR